MGDLTKDFSRWEFECPCGCGFDTVDIELVTHFQYERDYFGVPITITSGCRCPEYNRLKGGADDSQHLYGRAGDSKIKGVSPQARYEYYNSRWPRRYGIGLYTKRNFLHFDTRSGKAARWVGKDDRVAA